MKGTLPKLILLEGIPGSGKSSTTHLLGLHLKDLGYQTDWFFERDNGQPISKNFEWPSPPKPDLTSVEKDQICQMILAHWRDLIDSIRNSEKIVLLDSNFFQLPIHFHLLLNESEEKARSYVLEVAQIIDTVDPLLVYFHQTNVETAINGVLKIRGKPYEDYLLSLFRDSPYGRTNNISETQEVIKTYQRYQVLTDDLYSELPMRKIRIDISDTSKDPRQKQLTEFLNLPPFIERFNPNHNADRLTGQYQSLNSDETFFIELNDSGLIARNTNTIPLIPKDNYTYSLLGTRTELRFHFDEIGNDVASHVDVNEVESGTNTTWTKISTCSQLVTQ